MAWGVFKIVHYQEPSFIQTWLNKNHPITISDSKQTTYSESQ